MRAAVVNQRPAHALDAAVAVDRDLDVVELIAFLMGGGEMLAPVLDIFDRPSYRDRRRGDGEVFGIRLHFRAEAAAGVRRDHPDPVVRLAGHAAIDVAQLVRRLGVGPDGQRVGDRLVGCQHGAAFHGVARAAMLEQGLAEDMRRPGERRIGLAVADGEFGGDIVLAAFMRHRRAGLERVPEVAGRRQRFVVDVHRFGRILGDVAVVGDHQGHGLADEMHRIGGQNMLGYRITDRRIGHQQRHRRLQRLRQVRMGEHRMHAGHFERRCRVDAGDPRMRKGAADDRGLQRARQVNIVDEFSLAGEERGVLEPWNRAADPAHGSVGLSPRSVLAAASAASTMP